MAETHRTPVIIQGGYLLGIHGEDPSPLGASVFYGTMSALDAFIPKPLQHVSGGRVSSVTPGARLREPQAG